MVPGRAGCDVGIHCGVRALSLARVGGDRGASFCRRPLDWSSPGLTDNHHQGRSPGKDVHNGGRGTEEAPWNIGVFLSS